MDSIPAMRDVARDLGLWGVATHLPNIFAPLVGGWLIASFHGTRPGYQAVFALAGLSFALAAVTVLRVGRRPVSSWWGWPIRFAANATNFVWVRIVYRIRHWGRIPRRRGPTLIVANHQHDLESMTIVSTLFLESSSLRHPIFTASSRRMYEPGFLALRLPWMRAVLRRVNAGPLFVALGLLPLENELSSREVSGLAWSLQRSHGPLRLSDVFDERVTVMFPPGTKTSDLWRPELFGRASTVVKVAALREPYRREILDETRHSIAEDLARMEDVVRRGATFYLTPEGRYSTDGRIGTMRGVVDRLAPLTTIYLAGVSYDPFVAKRLSMLFRVMRLGNREHMVKALAAIRPVVTSQLLASWLCERSADFTEADAIDGITARLDALPRGLFVDPELPRNLRRFVRAALPLMTQWNILESHADRYRLAAIRRHPQFPMVDDIVAYQARFLEETVANAAWSQVVVEL
jgi:1-acyl-sn-glycerol-3-phosphate acyltransferase